MTSRQAIAELLCQFLAEDTDLRLEQLDESMSLKDGLGLDSVDMVGIIMRIEGHYRIRLQHNELEEVKTVGDLLDLIQGKLAGGSGSQAA